MELRELVMVGRYIAEKVIVLPIFDATRDRGRLLYVTSEYKCYLGGKNGWVYVSPDYDTLQDHESRIATNESAVPSLSATIDEHEEEIFDNENNISTISTDLSDHIGSNDEHPLATQSTQGFINDVDKTKLDGIGLGKIQTGSIIMYAGSTPPNGYFECNGSAISRTEYSDLYNEIGTIYGAGNGSTTFNLPNLQNRFARGWDNGRGVDSGRVIGSFQNEESNSHRHDYRDRYFMEIYNYGGIDGVEWHGGGPYTGSRDTDTDNRYTPYYDTYTWNSGSSETKPRNVALMFIIKY